MVDSSQFGVLIRTAVRRTVNDYTNARVQASEGSLS
jgi:hypothetical protein